jgi:hypothetical protein
LLNSQDVVGARRLLAHTLHEADGDAMLGAEIHRRLAFYFRADIASRGSPRTSRSLLPSEAATRD